jgi:sporulation protein YlmC with PRC-barrel domain
MPQSSAQKILGLPVVTESGTTLGKVRDVNLDLDTHMVNHYIVAKRLQKTPLLITPKQVVSISDERMVVEDTTNPNVVEAEMKASQSVSMGASFMGE